MILYLSRTLKYANCDYFFSSKTMNITVVALSKDRTGPADMKRCN